MSKVLSFEQEFTRSFDDLAHILRHVREAIGVTETQWSDLTKVNLIRVANHIKTKVSSNSARTYFAVLCGFIHKYEDEGIFEQDSGLMRPGRGDFTQDEYDAAVLRQGGHCFRHILGQERDLLYPADPDPAAIL